MRFIALAAGCLSCIQLALADDSSVAALARRAILEDSASTPGFQIGETELGIPRVIRNPFGYCVRFPRLVEGIAVLGAELIVDMSETGAVTAVRASPLLRPHLANFLSGPLPLAPAPRVVSAIKSFLREAALRLDPHLLRPLIVPVGGRYYLAFSLRHFSASPFGLWELYFDAADGSPLWARNLARFENLGNVYPISPIESDVTQVELTGLGGDGFLTGPNTKVFNCVVQAGNQAQCVAEQVAHANENGDFLYPEPDEKDPEDSFAEVNMFYHVETMHEFFASFGFDGFDNLPLMAIVNYRTDQNGDGEADPFDNAAFVPGGWGSPFGNNPGLLFGQGTTIDFALDATVIAHEFTHSLIGETSNLDLFNWDDIGLNTLPLAINEGSADYFAASKLGTPKIGSYIASGLMMGDALRELDNELACPRGLAGEPHEDGKIWGGALWDIREQLGEEQGNELAYTIVTTLPSDSDFSKAGTHAIAKAREALGDETAGEVEQTMSSRGIIGCERIVPLLEEPHTGIIFGKELLGQFADRIPYIPASIEYVLELPPNTESVRLKMANFLPVPGTDIRVFVRKGEIVKNSIRALQLTTEKDFEITGDKTYDMGVSYGDALFEAGNTYYFQPANYGLPTTQYQFSAELFLGESLPDAGVPDAGGAGGETGEGCLCSNSTAGTGIPTLMLIVLVLLVRGRREFPPP